MNGAVAAMAAEYFEHGTRSRYVKGCRCALCRASNTAYYHQRQAAARERLAELEQREQLAESVLGTAPTSLAPQVWTKPDGSQTVRFYARACPGVDGPCPTRSHLRKDSKGGLCEGCRKRFAFNGLVSAERARAHLLELSEAGVGRRAVAAASDVGATVLQEIRAGRQTRIRADTERRILAVDAAARADSSLVDWHETWRAVRQLQRWGWTLGRISQEGLGNRMAALQLNGSKVLARTEHAIRQLLERERTRREALGFGARGRPKNPRCPRCQQDHADDPTAAAWCLANLDVPVDELEVA